MYSKDISVSRRMALRNWLSNSIVGPRWNSRSLVRRACSSGVPKPKPRWRSRSERHLRLTPHGTSQLAVKLDRRAALEFAQLGAQGLFFGRAEAKASLAFQI